MLRTYGWTTPTLSLGYFQSISEAESDPRFRERPIVRRPTGGGEPGGLADMAKDKKSDGPRGRNDAYTMMLFITLLAVVGGTVLMYLDHEEYGKNPPAREKAFSPPQL